MVKRVPPAEHFGPTEPLFPIEPREDDPEAPDEWWRRQVFLIHACEPDKEVKP